MFIAVGTSLQVQPSAGLAADHGAPLVIVNAEPTPYDAIADEVVREPIGTALPRLGSHGQNSAVAVPRSKSSSFRLRSRPPP